jgi:hypothetical protein
MNPGDHRAQIGSGLGSVRRAAEMLMVAAARMTK